jgi:single-stranded-DNA-specific exonuclease
MRKVKETSLSVNGNLWKMRDVNQEIDKYLSENQQFPKFIQQILAQKFSKIEEIEAFLNSNLKFNLKDPYLLLDMEKAIEIFYQNIKDKKNIYIFADYDVDGTCSAAIIKRYAKAIDCEINFYIPDRIKEGYGPNCQALKQLKEQGAELIIMVDCGIVAFEAVKTAKEIGLEVIILDHHIATQELPIADAIVNPSRLDEDSEQTYLCAAGVCYLFIIALNRKLKKEKYFEQKKLKEFDLFSLLGITAVATICDVVPLKNLNRAFVKQGIKLLKQNPPIFLQAIAQIADFEIEDLSCYHLGYIIGPRINAAGRVADASLGAQLLLEDDLEQAIIMAKKLELRNKERKALEDQVLSQAKEKVEKENLAKNNMLIVAGENWHPGVIGIVASRLKERYKLATSVISIDGETAKSSVRSLPIINIADKIKLAKENNLLVAGGGHAMAAGFTIETKKLAEFNKFMQENTKSEMENNVNVINYDCKLPLSAISVSLIEELKILEPYGQANSEPKFLIENCKLCDLKILKNKHHKARLVEYNQGIYGKSLDIIFWNSVDTKLDLFFANYKGQIISLIAKLKINKWNNYIKPQIEFIDLQLPTALGFS